MQHLREATETKERAKSRKVSHHQKQTELGTGSREGLGGRPSGGLDPAVLPGWGSVAKSWAT